MSDPLKTREATREVLKAGDLPVGWSAKGRERPFFDVADAAALIFRCEHPSAACRA